MRQWLPGRIFLVFFTYTSLDCFKVKRCLFVLKWMTIRVLTTCRTQYTWDSSICIFLFHRTTLQVFVTYLTGAPYVHPLWFYKHQHDNRVRSKLSVACQWWWFQRRFWFVPSVWGYLQEEEEHKPDPWRNPIERNHMGLHLENELARRVASDHHWSHAGSIAAVNGGLKILWYVSGNWAWLYPSAIWNQHCPCSVGVAAIHWAYPRTLYPDNHV